MESRLMGQRETKRKTVTGSLDTENCSYIEFVLINMLQASATNHLTPLIEGDGIILQDVLVCENHGSKCSFWKVHYRTLQRIKSQIKCGKKRALVFNGFLCKVDHWEYRQSFPFL